MLRGRFYIGAFSSRVLAHQFSLQKINSVCDRFLALRNCRRGGDLVVSIFQGGLRITKSDQGLDR